MVKRVLMVAYHYPPVQGSSGLQRTLQFSRYLPEYGWSPIVLTAQTRAYSQTREDEMADIPADAIVKRAFALDAGRHLAIQGKFPGILAWPDRWSSWWLGAVPLGLRLIYKYRPQVIWSTYPIATAHLIALTLHSLTRVPWIADFRDPMTENDFPPDPLLRRVLGWVEARTVRAARRTTFTTLGASNLYAQRYTGTPVTNWVNIPNGYDEQAFTKAETLKNTVSESGPLALLHSGIIYPNERNPTHLFSALARLKEEKKISARDFTITLRASGYDALYREELRRLDIDDIVLLKPPLPYVEALAEMRHVDGLLLLQAKNCNRQIPAKAYEYLRAQRPILVLSDNDGDTAKLFRRLGVASVFDLDNEDQIYHGFIHFIKQLSEGNGYIPNILKVRCYSREATTKMLATLLDEVALKRDSLN